MRIIKEAEVRKNEILDVAEELFAVKGFDGTSTNDILKRRVLQEGTFILSFQIERGYSRRRDQPDDRSDGGEGN